MRKYLCALAFALLASGTAFALDSGTIPLGRRPEWVTPTPIDTASAIDTSLVNYGFYFILNDEQVSVSPVEHYRHYAYRVLNNAGLEEASELKLTWEPSYETLTIHSLTVYRDGAAIDYGKKVRWSELQREDSLDVRMYDETRTMLIILEDIREGDIVEYEYTTAGSNPIFGATFYGYFSHGLDYPMLSLHFRLIVPPGRNIAIRQHVRSLAQTVQALPGGGTEYAWAETRSPEVRLDPYVPEWYDAYPWIEMSEWRDWGEVTAWGRSVFDSVEEPTPSAELTKAYERILGKLGDNPTKEETITAILRFVQDEIRYFGIEIGVNSHKPRSPREVLDGRFGDCKDKALLFCSLARLAGWEAWPTLVNSQSGRNLADWLPSPLAFDHAISALRDGDGNWIWLDTTNSYQGGTLRSVHTSDYGHSLILFPDSIALTRMGPEKPGEIAVSETYASAALDEPGTLDVVTTYRGAEADRMRYKIATTGSANLEKSYLDFYQIAFPEAEKTDAMISSDDRDANVIETRERYRVPQMWKADEDAPGERELAVYPYSFSYLFDDYADLTAKRSAPIAVTWPFKATHRITIESPIDLTVDDEDYASDNPWYDLRFSARRSGRALNLEYSYEARCDSVSAEDFARFREALKRDADAHTGYTLSTAEGKKGILGDWESVSWQATILIALGALGIGYALGFRRGKGERR